MDPLLDWIEAHARDTWTIAGLRASYEAVHGPTPSAGGQDADSLWRSAMGTAVYRSRVRTTLDDASGSQVIGDVLRGVLAFGDEVVVRVRVTGTDGLGHQRSVVLDVTVGRNDTINDLWALAHEAVAQYFGAGGLDIDDVAVAPGSYGL